MNFRSGLAAAALLAGFAATAAVASAGTRVAPGIAPAPPCKVIYLADFTGAKDLLYLNFSPWTSYSPLPALPAVDNGWGLWASANGVIYAGAAPNKINLHKACGSQIGFTFVTAGFGAPASIAADTSGNVYATEAGSMVVDWFSGVTDTPAPYDTPRAPSTPDYLALDNAGNVYLSGWNAAHTAEQVDVCGPHMVGCAPCELLPGGTGPGGVALDGLQNLIVNSSPNKKLYVFHPGCGTLASSYYYGPKFVFRDITLSTAENLIWGGNDIIATIPGCSSPVCMDAQAVKYSASSSPVVGPLVPAHTAPIINSQKAGSGIAVYPPGPI